MKRIIITSLVLIATLIFYAYGQETCIIKAQKLLKAGKCGNAISVLKKCAGRNGAVRNGYAFFLELGNAYLMCKNTVKAFESYRKGFSLNSKSLALCEGVARTSFELKHYIDAARYYENCSRLRVKDRTEYLFMSAYSYYLGGRFQDSLRLVEGIIESAKGKVPVEWLKLWLNAAVESKSWDKAERAALSLIDVEPENPLFWKELAVAERNLDRLLDAAAAFDIFLIFNKRDIKTKKLLMNYYLNAGVYRRALELCKEIREGGDRESCSFNRMVDLYIASGDIKGMLSVINDDAEGKSDAFGCLLKDKGKLLVQTGYYDEGMKLLERYLKDYGEAADALFWLGVAFMYEGSFQKAIDILSRVESICFQNKTTNFKECKSAESILSSLNQIDL